MKYKIILILCLFSINGIAQIESLNNLQVLSKNQMLEDFDYLQKIITEADPEIEPLSKVCGFDIKTTLLRYKLRIDTITSNYSFINNLIKPSLVLCRNKHIVLISPQSAKGFIDMLKNYDSTLLNKPLKYIDTSSFKTSQAMYSLVKYSDNYTFFRGLVYNDGKYYTRFPFHYKGKKYKIGQEIISVNGISPDSIISKYSVFELEDLKWDKKNNKFFSNDFYCLDSLKKPLVFKMKSQEINEIEIISSDKSLKWSCFQVMSNIPKVKYFSNIKVLYIRIPKMIADTSLYLKLISKKAHNKDIDKVVIDIRRNSGGTDLCWMSIIRSIIDTTLITNNVLIAKNNEIVRDYLDWNDSIDHLIKVPFFSDINYLKISHDADTLYPYSNSIRFKGKIFVIQDENIYSSAMAFSDYANHCDRLITVGKASGYIGGTGNVYLFMLPNSKLIFQMVPLLSITGAQKYEDLFIDVEIPVNTDINDSYNDVKFFKGQRLSKRFLLKKDPYFKTIINSN